MVEADVHAARGRLELRHEKNLGPLPLRWDRWCVARRPDRTVTLQEVLAAAPPGAPFLLDLKGVSPRLAGLVRQAVRSHAEAGVGLLAELVAACGRCAAMTTCGCCARSAPGRNWPASARCATAGRRRRPGPAAARRPRTAAALAGVPTVLAWGARDLATARRLLAAGASGLILDDLELIARISSSA